MQENIIPQPVKRDTKPPVKMAQSFKKDTVIIDADGNILSSPNPREAYVIGKQDFNN